MAGRKKEWQGKQDLLFVRLLFVFVVTFSNLFVFYTFDCVEHMKK